jgi:hypothetical protein
MPGDEFFPGVIDLSQSSIQVVQTSRTNPRVVMDKNGLRAYDGAGNIVFNLDATTGSITLTGGATISGAVSAHGFKFYDDTHGFVYALASARPAGAQPIWNFVGPLWSDVKALGLTWGQVKALVSHSWDNFRKYVVQQRGL